MFKPKIIYCRSIGYWICIGNGLKGYGCKPNTAYNKWRVQNDIKEYLAK